MKRLAFKMYLTKGYADEYKKRHNEIWPELKLLLKESGIANYSIFLDEESYVLFGVLDCHDFTKYTHLSLQPIMRKWWDCMKDIMQTNDDNSPVSIPLQEVFYLD